MMMCFIRPSCPSRLVHERFDYTVSDQAVSHSDAKMEVLSTDVDGEIETTTVDIIAGRIAESIKEIINRQEDRMIELLAEKIDRKTNELNGDSRLGLRNPRKIILPVLLVGVTVQILRKQKMLHQWITRFWWRILEKNCVGDKFEMLVTDLSYWENPKRIKKVTIIMILPRSKIFFFKTATIFESSTSLSPSK